MKNNGVEGVSSDTSVDPIAELKTVPGVDTSKLQTFETEASDARRRRLNLDARLPTPPAAAEAQPCLGRRRRRGPLTRPHLRPARDRTSTRSLYVM